MPLDFTSGMHEQSLGIEKGQLITMLVVDVASTVGYVTFTSTGNKITAVNKRGLFVVNRLRTGDMITITGSVSNDGTYTIASVSQTELTVSESVVTESSVKIRIVNLKRFVMYDHNVMYYDLEDEDTINTPVIYTALNGQLGEATTVIKENGDQTIKFGISNINRVFESYLQNRVYLRGCFAYIISAFEAHFPTGTGYMYIGSSSDYRSRIIERYIIDEAESDEKAVQLTCRYKTSLKNITLPARTLDMFQCSWVEEYGGPNCDPLGELDLVTYPTCNGSIGDCREREHTRRFGAFPSVPKNSIYI